MKHWWLYILRLKEGKYYVGITSKSPEKRLEEHKSKLRAAYWTMKYEPLEIIYREDLGLCTKTVVERRENKMVRACLKRYGVNNVRGGDLRDTEDYVIRFGRVFDKDGWRGMIYIILVLLLLAAFYVDKYLFVFIPGGVR